MPSGPDSQSQHLLRFKLELAPLFAFDKRNEEFLRRSRCRNSLGLNAGRSVEGLWNFQLRARRSDVGQPREARSVEGTKMLW